MLVVNCSWLLLACYRLLHLPLDVNWASTSSSISFLQSKRRANTVTTALTIHQTPSFHHIVKLTVCTPLRLQQWSMYLLFSIRSSLSTTTPSNQFHFQKLSFRLFFVGIPVKPQKQKVEGHVGGDSGHDGDARSITVVGVVKAQPRKEEHQIEPELEHLKLGDVRLMNQAGTILSETRCPCERKGKEELSMPDDRR